VLAQLDRVIAEHGERIDDWERKVGAVQASKPCDLATALYERVPPAGKADQAVWKVDDHCIPVRRPDRAALEAQR